MHFHYIYIQLFGFPVMIMTQGAQMDVFYFQVNLELVTFVDKLGFSEVWLTCYKIKVTIKCINNPSNKRRQL